MEKYLYFGFSLFFLFQTVLASGLEKPPKNYLKVESNGLSIDDAYLSAYGQRFSSDQLQFQTKVNLNLDGVKGYSIKDDQVFIGCSMQVFDKNGVAILSEDDLFPGENGLERKSAGNLFFTLIVGTPMQLGESYVWKVKVWDKIGSGEVKTELNFKIVETGDKVGIAVNSNGLKVRSVFMTNQDGALQSNRVAYSEKIKLNFYDLHGFSKSGGKVFVGGSMVIKDSGGNVVLEYTDLFADYDQTGVDPVATEKLHLSLIIGDPLKKGETYTCKARVWDKSKKGEVMAEAKLVVGD